MADLITADELKPFLKIALDDTSQDDHLAFIIEATSAAIRTFTGRNFAGSDNTTTITYKYDLSGWIEIDDASEVTQVTLEGTVLLPDYDYVLGPDRGYLTPDSAAIYEWIELTPGFGQSPEMGFTRNADTLWKFGRRKRYYNLAVTGTFGWPTVPPDVKQAAIWTAVEFYTSPSPRTTETIAGYSVSQDSNALTNAIPRRAQELLLPFKRFS